MWYITLKPLTGSNSAREFEPSGALREARTGYANAQDLVDAPYEALLQPMPGLSSEINSVLSPNLPVSTHLKKHLYTNITVSALVS